MSRPGLSFSVAPLLLTHVYRAWKSIAVKTPQLWSSIYAEIPTHHQMFISRHKSHRKRLDSRGTMLNDWLDQSGTLPLSIALKARVYLQATEYQTTFLSSSTAWSFVPLVFIAIDIEITRLIRSFNGSFCVQFFKSQGNRYRQGVS